MNGNALSKKQLAAVSALIKEPTILAAAHKIGVNECTIRRWLQETDFKEAYRTSSRDVFLASIGRLSAASEAAVETLTGIMLDATTPASTRCRACMAVLELGIKSMELQDLEDRIEALEEGKIESVRERMLSDLETVAEKNRDHGREASAEDVTARVFKGPVARA